MDEMKKLCLGTVRLGLPDYGFPSTEKEVRSEDDLIGFLHDALSLGISKIDTSPRYGNSEKIIGQALKGLCAYPFISSKIDSISLSGMDIEKHMIGSVEKSLMDLNISSLDLCYLHQNQLEIISNKVVQKTLINMKDRGLIKNIGLSLYYENECEYAMALDFIDYIQVPVNIMDTFLYHLILKKRPDIKISARSLLLQGLLVNDTKNQIFQNNNKKLFDQIKKIRKRAKELGMTPLEFSLKFSFSIKNIDHFIIGTTSFSNLKSNIRYLMAPSFPKEEFNKYIKMSSIKRPWVNPKAWHCP